MSKKISYKGTLPIGLEDKISLRTINGKTGYKITKFQIIGTAPGPANAEYIAKVTKVKDTNISSTINFTDADLLAVAYLQENTSTAVPTSETIIFDNEKFNQDIFINITDASGGTQPCNYYIELEAMSLNDLQATQLTLKSIRTITS